MSSCAQAYVRPFNLQGPKEPTPEGLGKLLQRLECEVACKGQLQVVVGISGNPETAWAWAENPKPTELPCWDGAANEGRDQGQSSATWSLVALCVVA